MIYVYDGTFEGLLTVLATLRDCRAEPADITAVIPPCADLFHGVREVGTEPELAERLAAEIERRVSPSALATIFRAFLAEAPGGEMLIYRYLELGRQVGRGVDGMLSHDRVAPVRRLARAVGREAHRMKGFVRFREVRGGFYYAGLDPDYYVLPLIARHFADRFRDQNWVIHDLRRGKGIVHDAARREWVPADIELTARPELAARELDFQGLWQSYFAHTAVKERQNLRLQRSRLPLKHRRHLVEIG